MNSKTALARRRRKIFGLLESRPVTLAGRNRRLDVSYQRLIATIAFNMSRTIVSRDKAPADRPA